MKLAHPEKTVIVSCGDGTYMFNNPTACHFVSQAYDLPRANDRLQQRNLALHQGGNPTGHAGRLGGQYRQFSSAQSDAVAALRDDRRRARRLRRDGRRPAAELLPALKRALKVVKRKSGKHVLNVICGAH